MESPLRFSRRLLISSLFLAWASLSWPAAPAEIRIGCLFSLSGGDSTLGRAAQLAVEDHVRQVNAQGGIQGRKIRLVVYDDQTDLAPVQALAPRLVEKDHVVAILGPGMSTQALFLGPLSESAKVPVITTYASFPEVTMDSTGAARPYLFRACALESFQQAALADYAFQALGKHKAAIIAINAWQWTQDAARFFATGFRRQGGQVVFQETVLPGPADFRPHLARIMAAKPDCLVVPTCFTNEEIALMARQAQELGLKVPFLGSEDWAKRDLLRLAGRDIEGAVFPTAFAKDDPRFAGFNASFEKAHHLPCENSAYYALDGLMALEHVIRLSLEKTGRITPGLMRDALENLKDVPVFTGKLTMDPKTHNPRNRTVLIVAVKDGRWQTLKTCVSE